MPSSPWWLRSATRTLNWLRTSRKAEHQRRLRAARKVLDRVRTIEGEAVEARTLGYLRCIDPWVFEELVLYSFERAGLAVWRNAAYTGDGGLDGHVHVPLRGWCPVQCKRYREHIDATDVQEFRERLGRRAGILVHTGRTGALSRSVIQDSSVLLCSGSTLIRLVRHQALPPALVIEAESQRR